MKLPESYHNKVSYFGVFLASSALTVIFILWFVASYFHVGSSYIGLFIFMIVPAFFVTGLLLIPIGMHFKRKRIKKYGAEIEPWPVWNLNSKPTRNAFAIFFAGTLVFGTLTAVGSYQAFHYSESNEFCGLLCHKVMSPEYTTYQNSPHAQVDCVECHIGEGVDWFVKAKITGLYQVYSVTFGLYPRPIPTPIENLRPARETCEKCHWPEKFYSATLRNFKHFLADSANSAWDLEMKMKIGSDHSAKGLQSGIHWHINPNVRIEYMPIDAKRESIPWVRYINLETGDTTIYENASEMPEAEAFKTFKTRTMDCMDCHNRPAHHYDLPQEFIDDAITAGKIPGNLPMLKATVMALFNATFTTTPQALDSIRTNITAFYTTNYPDLVTTRSADIEKAIVGIQTAYKNNVFTEMKANWDAYPKHIGHKEYIGCFRCHGGNHQSKDGKTISKDCNLCHDIISQGNPSNTMFAGAGIKMQFKHPVDIDGAEVEGLCSDCHRYLYQ